MEIPVNEKHNTVLEIQQSETRKMVLAGLEQIRMGKTKDFGEVCNRLEKKYRNAAIRN